jgi:hypothetical protein
MRLTRATPKQRLLKDGCPASLMPVSPEFPTGTRFAGPSNPLMYVATSGGKPVSIAQQVMQIGASVLLLERHLRRR